VGNRKHAGRLGPSDVLDIAHASVLVIFPLHPPVDRFARRSNFGVGVRETLPNLDVGMGSGFVVVQLRSIRTGLSLSLLGARQRGHAIRGRRPGLGLDIRRIRSIGHISAPTLLLFLILLLVYALRALGRTIGGQILELGGLHQHLHAL